MKQAEEKLIKVLQSYISNSPIDSLNLDDVLDLAKIHSTDAILKVVCDKYNLTVSEENAEKLNQAFMYTVMYSTKQDNELRKIIKLLNENEIPHLLTKGVVLKKLYPNADLRTMGDIDILVKPEDFDKAIDLLKSKEYKIINSHLKEIEVEKNGVFIEIHTSLIEENFETGFDYIKYYSDVFSRAEKKEGYTYQLSADDHLIYLLVHIGKHFYNEGCGIRMIMDIAVYCDKVEINWNYVLKELERIKLKKLAFNVFYLCKRYFGTEFDFEIEPMDEKLFDALTEYIMSGGTYGFYRENLGNKAVRKYKGLRMIKYVFPGVNEMRELCFWFKDKPTILLPVAWLIRIIKAVKNGKAESMKNTKKENVEADLRLLKGLGIYR